MAKMSTADRAARRAARLKCPGVYKRGPKRGKKKNGYNETPGGGCPTKVAAKPKAPKAPRKKRETKAARQAREYHSGGGSYASGYEKWKASQSAARSSEPDYVSHNIDGARFSRRRRRRRARR